MATSTQTAGQQSFNTAYPLDFKIKNQYKGEGLSVLYIVDKIDDTAPAQEIHLELLQTDTTPYTIRTFANASNDNNYLPDQNRFNLALGIRPGILKDEVINDFKSTLQNAINTEFVDEQNMCLVNGPIVRASDGALMWYINFQKNVEVLGSDSANWNKVIKLNGIVAEAGVGTRSTQVEMIFSNVFINNNTDGPITFTRNTHVDIINHQGKTYAPIISGLVGSNVLLNQSGFKNSFSLYLQSIGNIKIPFDQHTKISLSFPTYENSQSQQKTHNYFGDKSLVNAYEISTRNEVKFWLNDPSKDDNKTTSKQVSQPSWKLESYLDKSESITLSFPSTGTEPNPEIARIKADIEAFSEFASQSKSYFDKQDTDISQAVKDAIEPTLNKIKLLSDCYNNLSKKQGVMSTMGLIRNCDTLDSNVPDMAFELNEAFSLEAWNQKYTNMINWLGSQNVDSDAIAQRINISVFPDLKFNTEEAWSDNDFVAYVEANFTSLINKLNTANNPVNSINWYATKNYAPVGPTDNFYMFPTGPVYDFLQINYIKDKFSKQLHFTPDQNKTWTIENPDTIYDILFIKPDDPFSTERWIGTYGFVSSLDTNSTNLLTSAPGVNTYFDPTKPWADANFVNYVSENFKLLLDGNTNITFNGKNYVCPCQSLYDYFWYTYRASDDGILSTLSKTVDTYMELESYVLDFSNIQISGESGGVLLQGILENVPGYWDTPFHVELIKAPSKLDQNLQVPNGTATIGGKGHFKSGVRIEGPGENNVMLSLGGNGDVAIDAPKKIAQRFVVKDNGNVGINQPDPGKKLSVAGDVEIDGELNVGNTSISSVTDSDSNNELAIDGRIKDQTGYVMPVGSIIAFGGTNPPDGWLLCNGDAIPDDTKFQELKNVLGGNNTPNLAGRTIIGTGKPNSNTQSDGRNPNFDSDNVWPVNYTGGEYKHKLSINEMPNHSHSYQAHNERVAGDNISMAGTDISAADCRNWNKNKVTASSGNGDAHNNMPPYWALTYIIKY